MLKKTITLELEIRQLDELSSDDRQLVEMAMTATDNAYCKYSNFHVGAALRLADGTIVMGANQENAAFPSGLCAERTAIFAAQAQHPDQAPAVLAIAARTDSHFTSAPIAPCGACRQVMMEMEQRYNSPLRLLLYGTDGTCCLASAKLLMPLAFADEYMH